MCIDCDGHHSGGSSLIYVKMIFVISEIVCITIGTGSGLRKNMSMRVLVYSIDSIAPRTSVQDPPIGSDRDPTGVTVLSGIRAPTGGITI